MCGRYVTPEQAAAEREFSLRRSSWHFQARYNVAPSLEVPIVRLSEGGREGLMMRWGLVPFFAHGETPRYSTINARAETLATAASYRAPWRRGQRCLLPAAGLLRVARGRRRRQDPWFIQATDQTVFGFAGLWDRSVRHRWLRGAVVHDRHAAGEPAAGAHPQREATHAGDPRARRPTPGWAMTPALRTACPAPLPRGAVARLAGQPASELAAQRRRRADRAAGGGRLTAGARDRAVQRNRNHCHAA